MQVSFFSTMQYILCIQNWKMNRSVLISIFPWITFPNIHIMYNCVCSHFPPLSNLALQKHEISKNILLSMQSLFCEHWNFPHHLVTVFKKGIGEQLIYVYTQNMTLFVVHATVHHTIVLCVPQLYKQHIYKTELLSIMQITRWDARCHAC